MSRNTQFSNVDIHVETNLLPCKYRRLLTLQKLMFNQVTSATNIDTRNLNTRQHDSPLLVVAKPNSVKFKQSASFLGPTEWNSLPFLIRNIKDKDQFKKHN